MTVVALCSLKHSPGVTTLGLALTTAAACLGQAALVEADPAGGDLAAYVGCASDPGLVSLAAALRHPGTPADVAAHTIPLPIGGRAVVGPGDAGQASAALAAVSRRLPIDLTTGFDHAVIDCGRIGPVSPAWPVLEQADRVLVVVPATLAGIDHLRSWTAELFGRIRGHLGVVLSGPGPYRPDEVASATSLTVEGTLPRDPRGAAGLTGLLSAKAARRTPLGRAARSLAESLFGPSPAEQPPTPMRAATR